MFKNSFNFFEILFVQISDIGQHVVENLTAFGSISKWHDNQKTNDKLKVFLVLLGHIFMIQLQHIMGTFSSISSKKWFFILAK